MTGRPTSSLPTQIAAVERALHEVPSRKAKTFISQGAMMLEQAYLSDAIRSLEWLSENREWIFAAVSERRAAKLSMAPYADAIRRLIAKAKKDER